MKTKFFTLLGLSIVLLVLVSLLVSAQTYVLEPDYSTQSLYLFGGVFYPTTLVISQGETVELTNFADMYYNLYSDGLGVYEVLDAGETITFTANTVGSYSLYCFDCEYANSVNVIVV